eukprot:2893375-Prymnesium_polylepis.1
MRMHLAWKSWLHGRRIVSSPGASSHRQMAHSVASTLAAPSSRGGTVRVGSASKERVVGTSMTT